MAGSLIGIEVDLFRIRVQKLIGFLFFVPFCGPLILVLKWHFRYRIENLSALRAQFKQLTRDRTPLLICSNHLTYLDSVLLIYAFGNHWWYLFHFRCLSWNLPAIEYSENWFFRLVGYLAKCIFINRGGSARHHRDILATSCQLLDQGEVLTMFPEGKRSRIGRFDDRKLAHGVGKVIASLPECRVLCVYLRAKGQEEFANFPGKGSRFSLNTALLHFRPEPDTARTAGEITRRIAVEIKTMEERYSPQ